jgi:two-component sensor histidine kinase
MELPAGTEAPWCARRAVKSKIGRYVSAARLDAILTVVSELVTNSVRYGPGTTIRLDVDVAEDGTVTGRVEDGGRGTVEVREGRDPAQSGMGLKLVDALADRWGVEDATSNVWFEFAPRRFGAAQA